MPKYLLGAGICLFVALASIALWLDRQGSSALPPPGKSATAPHEITASRGAIYSARFPDLQGNMQSLGQWDRKLLVVNFWATWCGPCKEEMPILSKLQARFGEQGLQIVGIAADSSGNVANFAIGTKIGYPLLVDDAGAIEFSKRLGNRLGLLPHTVLFSPGGDAIYNKLGMITEAEMSDIILKNLPIRP